MSATSIRPVPDCIFVSYDEENAEQHFERLKKFFPHAKRVHGVSGIGQAYHAAARISDADRFIMVDGDNWVHNDFHEFFRELGEQDIQMWPSLNGVNRMRSYNGGVKLLRVDCVLACDPVAVDFFVQLSGTRKMLKNPVSDTRFNYSPFSAWRGAFRECAKIAGGVANIPQAYKALEIWQTLGARELNGEWCIKGARAGREFGEKYRNAPELMKLNDADWLKARFQMQASGRNDS